MTTRTSEIETERPGILLFIVEKVIPTDVKAWLILELTHMAMYMMRNENNRIKI